LVPEADDAQAAEIAKRHNATVLIYGVVKPSSAGFAVEPRFYVADAGFAFGSELVGSDRLGTPVTFTTPLTPGQQLKINEQLNARMLALRHTITGLALFYLGRYDESGASFRRAATVEGWRDEDGKEVAYLLIGAAKLRLYNQQTEAGLRSTTLAQAAEAFSQTYRLNPNYARSYLGLGAVALQEATMPNPNASSAVACATRGIPRVDTARLQVAQKWYTDSQTLADQPLSAHIAAKADYGLGQIQLLGFECALPGWSPDTARSAFARVVAAYEADRSPDLIWLAGNAHTYLGRLAGHQSDWPTMTAEYHTAIDLFNEMPGDPPRRTIALAWESLAYAEEQRGQLDAAREAYRQAIKIGTDAVEGQKVDSWRRKLEQLGGAQ
jgi:tetratricopeptide (TPR) repeat protein